MHVERRILAHRRDVVGAGVGGEAEQLVDARAQRLLPGAGAEPRLARFGAAQQECLDRLGRHPQAERGERIEQVLPPAGLGIGQQVGEHLAHQQQPLAVLHRAAAGDQSRLVRERAEQPLGERMDRVDAQPAAGTIEHGREQGTGACLRVRTEVRTDGPQFGGELGRRQANPAGEAIVDALGHLGRAGLGEGQAQDLRGRDAGPQQQPQHARGQHLRLAGARRGREPDGVLGRDRRHLVAVKGLRAAHAARPSSGELGSSRKLGSHSSRRMSWSKSL